MSILLRLTTRFNYINSSNFILTAHRKNGGVFVSSQNQPASKTNLLEKTNKEKTNKPRKRSNKMTVTLIKVGESQASQLQKKATKVNCKTIKAAMLDPHSIGGDKNHLVSSVAQTEARDNADASLIGNESEALSLPLYSRSALDQLKLENVIPARKPKKKKKCKKKENEGEMQHAIKLVNKLTDSVSGVLTENSFKINETDLIVPKSVDTQTVGNHYQSHSDNNDSSYSNSSESNSFIMAQSKAETQSLRYLDQPRRVSSTGNKVSSNIVNSLLLDLHSSTNREHLEEPAKISDPISNKGITLSALSKSKIQKNKKLQTKAVISQTVKKIRTQQRFTRFNRELDAYLSVCVNTGMVNRACHTLLYYHHAKHFALTSVCPYNTVMLGHYIKGNYSRVPQVSSWIREKKLKPDATTHALHIASLHRIAASIVNSCASADSASDVSDIRMSNRVSDAVGSVLSHYQLDVIQSTNHVAAARIGAVLKEMNEQGMTLDHMFSRADFVYDIRTDALQGIRRMLPDYTPTPLDLFTSPGYSCQLLKSLNTVHNYDVHTTETAEDRSSCEISSVPSADVTQPYLPDVSAVQEQFNIELRGDSSVPSVHGVGHNSFFRKKLELWKNRWHEALLTALTSELEAMHKSFFAKNVEKRVTLYPYLIILPPEKLVNIMIQEMLSLASGSENHSPALFYLHNRLTHRVFDAFNTLYKTETGVVDKLKRVYGHYTKIYSKYVTTGLNGRILIQQLAQVDSEGPSINHGPPKWPYSVHIELGHFLYNLMIKNVFVWHPMNNEKYKFPAMCELNKNSGYLNVLEVRPHAILCQVYRESNYLNFSPTELPMLCPPLPWTTHETGGYLLQAVPMVRLPPNVSCPLQRQRLQECPLSQLAPNMDSLNLLSYVPWRVNTAMLDVLLEVFTNNTGADLDVPHHPSLVPRPVPVHGREGDSGPDGGNLEAAAGVKKNKSKHLRDMHEYYKKKNEIHSLWCTALYKISIAKHYRDRVFWFPHNLDFRGRAYPCPPHLSHFDSDVFRSLLHFAVPRPLGERGLNWLKIHLINLTGLRKHSSLADRLKYCDAVLPDIIDSAVNPLGGRRWWTLSDEPWQTLAACKDLHAALQSPSPEEFESRLPVHQDGSCNGLQHYAALGRDIEGAVSVNLAPSHVPQDVYSAVARLVQQQQEQHAANPSSSYYAVARILQGHIKRKVVKQTVMTTVYGVTRFGAIQQVEKQLKEIPGIPPECRSLAARYVATEVFRSLEKMFTSTKEIQDWFTDCARLITTVCGQSVEWVTPMGLPIVQPYYKELSVKKLVEINKNVALHRLPELQLPNSLKQRNAFAPNFIHSLDASHMMLTALRSHAAGVTFASVHDCFWTHAATVDDMSKICRDEFVSLHSQPLLSDLSKFFHQRYGFTESNFSHDGSARDSARELTNHTLRAVPRLGDFDITQVKKSTFFFS